LSVGLSGLFITDPNFPNNAPERRVYPICYDTDSLLDARDDHSEYFVEHMQLLKEEEVSFGFGGTRI
jgi:hypothetical protein